MTISTKAGLIERLAVGAVICAEGYLFEFERRGYLTPGSYVPEIVLEHPELVAGLHRELVHAGSDVVEAFTYYANREKLRQIGREQDLEPMNRQALQIAKSVAHESGALFAGDIGNTNLFEPDDKSASSVVRAMFDEQTEWAIDAGVDMIIVETFYYAAEALVALDAARAAGVPVVVTLAMFDSNQTRDGWPIADACRRLEDAGASVVGLNCIRGPHTMLPLLKEVRAAVKCPVAALPVPFRTTEAEPTFQLLTDPCYHGQPNGRPYPTALEPFTCTRYEMGDFAREAYGLGVRYLGVCCGGGPQHVRSMAEALGRQPPASRYSADLANRAFLDQRLKIRG